MIIAKHNQGAVPNPIFPTPKRSCFTARAPAVVVLCRAFSDAGCYRRGSGLTGTPPLVGRRKPGPSALLTGRRNPIEPTNDLDRLALHYGSDKFGGHSYTPIYHDHFERMRARPLHLLELGIGGYDDPRAGGASLRMWRDYFPHAHIYGLDLFPKDGIAEERIHVFQGSQADPRAIVALADATPAGRFDIIIDDGSHRGEHTIPAFLMLFPLLANGGWYVVEDTETAYWPEYGGVRFTAAGRMNTMAFFREMIDGLNWLARDVTPYRPSDLDKNVDALHFYRNLIFIRKAPLG